MNQLTSIDKITSIVDEMGGEINHFTTYSQSGRQSKKIVIEYDIVTEK